jgi:TM2 domain-containing membrane protein YozV
VGVYRCAQCGETFKEEKKLFWRTLLIPGGEYFYVRQVGWGILQAMVEVIILIYALVLLGTAITSEGDDAASAAVAAVFIFLVWGLHKLAAYRQCRRMVRGFLPVE